MTFALRTTGLTKRYDDVAAVDGLDLQVERGALYGFLGPNGAGKTTTIRMALGLIHPTSGAVEVLGETVTIDRGPLRRVGALVEEPAFYRYLSGRKNLEYFARAGGRGEDTRRRLERIDECLAQVGLTDAADKRVKAYSQGMRQRLGHRPRAPRRARAPDARRADERPRPDRHAGDAAAPARAGRRRDDRVRLEPPAGRGRGDVRPRRRDGAGPDRRGGTAGHAPRRGRPRPDRGRRRGGGADRRRAAAGRLDPRPPEARGRASCG